MPITGTIVSPTLTEMVTFIALSLSSLAIIAPFSFERLMPSTTLSFATRPEMMSRPLPDAPSRNLPL